MDLGKYIASYREPYERALTELAELVERLEEIDIERDAVITRIGEVREGIAAFVPLVKENPAETHPDLFPDESDSGADLGLTDAIRKVLANSNPKRLTAVGVRTGLGAIGFQTKSKNILPSIHTVLKRLEKNEEISGKTEEDGRTWYKWNGPSRKPPLIPPPERRITQEQIEAAERRRAEARAAMESGNQSRSTADDAVRKPRCMVTPIEMLDKEGKPKKGIK